MDKRNCKTCDHAIFNELMGEYKCKALLQTVYDVSRKENCIMYEHKNNKK